MATTVLSVFSWITFARFIVICIGYQVLKILYRITLHPLAKFPGPKVAAATYGYEFYFDGIKRGSYVHEISRLHDQYGIRILSHRIHSRTKGVGKAQ